MQKQKIFPSYGMTKTEYAKRLQELENPVPPRSSGIFARFLKKS